MWICRNVLSPCSKKVVLYCSPKGQIWPSIAKLTKMLYFILNHILWHGLFCCRGHVWHICWAELGWHQYIWCPMLGYCWPIVFDAGPRLIQHWHLYLLDTKSRKKILVDILQPSAIVDFKPFYYTIKSLLLGMKCGIKKSLFANVWCQISQILVVFTHFKLWVALARNNFNSIQENLNSIL